MTRQTAQSTAFRSQAKRAALKAVDQLMRRGGSPEPPFAALGQSLVEYGDRRDRGLVITGTVGRSGPIFITGRFRSGTTLLWNVFRQCPDVTAYYEPFNERRWFDPAARGNTVDSTHRGVEDYWAEYEGLEELGRLFRRRWHERNLWMAEDARDPTMRRYVQTLIERASGRAILQFNRIDFRLPWFRRAFPEATILQIVRNPRELWCSNLIDPAEFGPDRGSDDFAPHDHYYLRLWVDELRQIPHLQASYAVHPYRAFYLLWRWSRAFGATYGDATLSYEALVGEPRETTRSLLAAIDTDPAALDAAAGVIGPPTRQRWRDYASDNWFAGHESAADELLRSPCR